MKKVSILLIIILKISNGYTYDRCETIFDTPKKIKSNSNTPSNKKSQTPKVLSQTVVEPIVVNIKGQSILFKNKILADQIAKLPKRPNTTNIIDLISLLDSHNALEVPLTESGFVPAASNGDHHGGYGSYIWYRDIARVLDGFLSYLKTFKLIKPEDHNLKSQVLKLSKAMLNLFSEDLQISRTLKNILDPEFHNDANNGFRNVIFVRLSLLPRIHSEDLNAEAIETESKWGHKQNDALALFAHALLDDLASGEIKFENLNLDMKAELIYLVSYFERIHFETMEDVGAWEEKMGVRTSSIGLVLSFIERFQKGWTVNQSIKNSDMNNPESIFFRKLRKDWDQGKIKDHLELFLRKHSNEFSPSIEEAWSILEQSLNRIPNAIDDAYSVLFNRLGISEKNKNDNNSSLKKLTYSDIAEVKNEHEYRGADAALLHLLLYPPQRFTLTDRLHIINQLKSQLMRPLGFARYNQDWFLYGPPTAIEFAGRLSESTLGLNPDHIAVQDPDGRIRSSSRADRDRVFRNHKNDEYTKNMTDTINETGAGQEAQWSFQDSMLTQIYVDLYKETRKIEFLDTAWFHLARALGFISDENQITIEGTHIESFKEPEAWIPVRIIENGSPKIIYLSSPNSPLHWSTSELRIALNSYLEALLIENHQ